MESSLSRLARSIVGGLLVGLGASLLPDPRTALLVGLLVLGHAVMTMPR